MQAVLAMNQLLLALVISLSALTAKANLLDAVITVGPNRGETLLATVSKKVPARAVEEALTFFDKNNGVRRTALIFPIAPVPPTNTLEDYICNMPPYACSSESVVQKLFENRRFIVIFDLNQSSMRPRFHIVDLMTGDVTSLHAAHGKGSTCANDPSRACNFISDRDSEASPLGFFATGKSHKVVKERWVIPLVGLQGAGPGASRNDVPSTIVIHGAPYASPEFRRAHGYMGRSHGCPAITYSEIAAWKDRLQGGALFYFFHDSLPREAAPASFRF